MASRAQGKHVRVLYDYDYKTSEGRCISIKEGDKCLLLKKTNSDWWSVIKLGDKKAIYVPANYVEEIRDSKKKSRLDKHGSLEDVADDEKSRSSSEDLLHDDDNAFENGGGSCDTSEHDSDSIRNKLTASEDSIDRIVEVDEELEKLESSNRVKSTIDKYEATEYENLETIQAEIRKRQESEPVYANITQIQAAFRSPPPVPGKGAEPTRVFANDWEMFLDSESGRQFYHNKSTGERTWKPPRGLRAKDTTSPNTIRKPPPVAEKPPPSPGPGRLKGVNSFGTAVVLGSTSDGEEQSDESQSKSPTVPPSPKVPSGWTKEVVDDGHVYINEHTNEKYLCSTDENGRVYFYKEDKSESTWCLPEVRSRLGTGSHQRHGSIDSAIPTGILGSLRSINTTSRARGDGLGATYGNYPPSYRHSIAASPSALSEDDPARKDKAPKMKPVVLPSVPDLILPAVTEGASSGPGSPESSDAPLTPGLSPTTPTESPSGSLNRQGTISPNEKRDTLNRTKITDNGKKVKKNWCPSYIYLSGSALYFYKDQKAAQKKASAPWGRPDEVIDLHGASVEMNNKEKTSRKNSILLTLLSGTQWLLQSDDQQKIQSWYGILCHNLAQMPVLVVARGSQESLNQSSDSLELLDDDSPQSARFKRKKSRKEKERDKGATQLTDKEKTNTLDDPNLTFPEKSSKIKDRLRNFFGQRPEKRTLQAKGIIKEVVFGANLLHLADREKTPVPRFVQQVVVTIEERGLGVDGIYRVSGNLAQIIKLRHMVDHNEKYDFDNPDWDIHVLTGSLKLFFRELMEPLFPYKQFEMFLSAIKLPDRSSKVKAFKDTVKTLPKPNRETMKFLFKHLLKVIQNSRENRMQTQNVAIVFGPTLMWPERETQNVAVTTVFQSQIVELMLLEYKNLF